jgi:hypothetical protein
MDSDDKGGPGSEPSVELQRRASGAAQRAADLATAGFPSFDALQARTGKYFARVEKKLDAVPAERQQPPPPTIAAPAAFQYALLGESDEVAELREMFENLLAASVDRETASNAHPDQGHDRKSTGCGRGSARVSTRRQVSTQATTILHRPAH